MFLPGLNRSMSHSPYLCRLSGSRGVQRLLLGSCLSVTVIACQGGVIEQESPEPQANTPKGLSVIVQGIEAKGDHIVLDLVAVNGSDDRLSLSDRIDPMILIDQKGNQYPSFEETVELAPYSITSLKVPFAGTLTRGTKELTLRTNSRHGNDFSDLEITIADLPARKGRRVEFSEFQPRQIELRNRLAQHPNGSTVRLQHIEYGSETIKVAFEAVNGLDEEIELADSRIDPPFLQDAQSNRYYLIPSPVNPDLSIPENQKLTGVLHFAGRVPASAGELSLHFNERHGNSDWDKTMTPKLVIDGLASGQETLANQQNPEESEEQVISQENNTSLPLTQPVDLQANSSDGSVLRISQITFTEDSTILDLAITNGKSRWSLELNRFRRMFLRDNRGGKYNLKPPSQNPEVEVTPGSTLKGRFVFLGRVSPEADSLALFADGFRIENLPAAAFESPSQPVAGGESLPQPDLPNSQTSATGLPNAQSLDLQTSHPNGTVLRVTRIAFGEDNIGIDLSATNGANRTIKLNSNRMVLRDDAGNQYNLQPPPQNPNIEIAPGATLKGKFIFLGRVSPAANSLTLVTNSQFGSSDFKYSAVPKMTISNIAVQR